MTVGELKKILAAEDEDTEIWIWGYKIQAGPATRPEPHLTDGLDIFDFDESKIDPGHLHKVLVF